ncbi:GNAT family N-acetyltransferase [Fructobacillus ficulneus]|uniref:Acetyltransferase n=1 Tax=Fructobacillus ficulneus TaxID=157463 RepID=A0A0K8MHI2_9LACO|nr:GNAT family N-acetyltransferase [Fructobacillus ficulneus]GAO99354.1 acetyltransferase [Fructobacillus ficulneus]
MNIRHATIEDAENIHRLAVAAFGQDQVPLALINQQLQAGRVVYLMADDLSAFLSYRTVIDETDMAFIAVSPDHQGQGAGQQLLSAFFAEVQPGKIFLEVAENNHVARHLYEKNGFQIYARRENYYHDGQTAILMEKIL